MWKGGVDGGDMSAIMHLMRIQNLLGKLLATFNAQVVEFSSIAWGWLTNKVLTWVLSMSISWQGKKCCDFVRYLPFWMQEGLFSCSWVANAFTISVDNDNDVI